MVSSGQLAAKAALVAAARQEPAGARIPASRKQSLAQRRKVLVVARFPLDEINNATSEGFRVFLEDNSASRALTGQMRG